MDSQYNDISDIVNSEGTLPINWDASGKMSLSKAVGSEDNLLTFHEIDGHDFDGDFSPYNFHCSPTPGNNKKTPRRTAFCSMPDLSTPQHQLPPTRGGPSGVAGSIVSTTALGGRGTPLSVCTNSSTTGHRYTLKEYEQQLDKLQKENFNLKLRIWRLEEEYRRKGGISNDVAKRELEAQISELSAKLDEKERMVKESLEVLNQLKANGRHQVAELRREHEVEMDAIRRNFSERVSKLEKLLQSANEHIETLQSENQRLSQLISFESGNPSLGGESDSDVSLLSHRERQVFDLKARVAMLERVLQSSSSMTAHGDEQILDEMDSRTPQAKQSGNSSAFETRTLRYDEVEMDALKREIAEKDDLLSKVQSEIKDKDDMISRFQSGVEDRDKHIGQLETAVCERDQYIKTLESTMEEKNQLIARLDAELERSNERLESIIQNQRVASNNSDDEKVRHLEAQLNVERANFVKSTKIIQGLLREMKNERGKAGGRSFRDASANIQMGASLLLTPPSEGASGDQQNEERDDFDSSTFFAWLNETAGIQIRQHDDMFQRQMAELQTARETLYDRLKRVADNLEDYGRRLEVGVDSKHVISALSSDLSVLRQDLQASLVNATYSIAAALAARGDAPRDARQQRESVDFSFNNPGIADNFPDHSNLSHLNLSNLSRLSNHPSHAKDLTEVNNAPQLHVLNKSAQTDPPAASIPNISSTTSPTASAEHKSIPDANYVERLHHRCNELSQKYDHLQKKLEETRVLKDKYERYAKKTKAKYRELLKSPSLGDIEGRMEELLAGYVHMDELVEGVVRQLEQNNRVLGERFDDHHRHDKKLKEAVKRETAKAKDLHRQLRLVAENKNKEE